jgi:PAS domain S-box-containing protein
MLLDSKTEQKNPESALRESEKRFRELSELLPDAVFEIDPKGVITFGNYATFELFGFSKQDFEKGLNLIEMLTPESQKKARQNMGRLLNGKKIDANEYIGVRKDGSTFPIMIHSTPIIKGKVPVGFRGIIIDITDRKKLEIELRASEERFRILIYNAPDAIWLQDTSGTFVDGNKRAEEITGYKRDELVGKNLLNVNLVPEKYVPVVLEALATLKIGERSDQTNLELIRKDGSLVSVETSAIPVERDGKIEIIGIARDITERKKAEEALKEANRLLAESNRDLESYTYVVSHDLKAPLRTIRSFSSFLLEDYKDKLDETGKDYLNRMINASSGLDTMIEDLLVLSRVGRKFTEREKVDLNKLLKEILADLEATIKERNAKVVVDKLPTLYVHRVWKRQLFMNLISNALKFNESKTPKIEVLYEERENDHLFKVRDNGIGIEKKYLDRIFNLFDRAPTEKKYEGTGAGLAICKKIVEHLGGKIWVESTPGKGSTFFFTIPKETVKQTKET